MNLGNVMEGADRGAPAVPQDFPMTDSTHSKSSRTLEGSRPPEVPGDMDGSRQPRSSPDVWAGAVSRLQTQASYNTGMLESHRRQITDIEQAVHRLRAEMGNVVTVVNELRAELRARPAQVEQQRHDFGDLDVLAVQIATVTNKANEVDGLRMQVELMKNRIRRFEEQGSPTAVAQRPGTSSTPCEIYEATPAPQQHTVPHQPLPPMRTASVMSSVISPYGDRPYPMQPPQVPSTHSASNSHLSEVRAAFSNEHAPIQSSAAGFKAGEALPPPSSISGWRSADTNQPSGLPPPPPPSSTSFRPHGMEYEPPTGGWAAVNSNAPMKRAFDEQRPLPYEASSAPGSPKRPKLASLMPRGSRGDESYAQTPSGMLPSAVMSALGSSVYPRSRLPSDSSQAPGVKPASAHPNHYRFITSTAQADSQDSWRPEAERMQQMRHAPIPIAAAGGGRGRGKRGGRGRGRGSRGGAHPPVEVEELGAPAWEHPDWTGSQISPNGYYNPLQPQRKELVRRSGGAAGGPSERRPEEYPATPQPGQYDADMQANDAGSAGKKSRTKPIRNAEGVLIRKDGRPDMRSVSSANNLRKVHAKKEAERAETDGRTPTSTRSLAPANSNSLSGEEEEGRHTRSGSPHSGQAAEGDEQDTQERHRELMSRIFPHGIDGTGDRGLASTYFPRPAEMMATAGAAMKTEEVEEEGEDGEAEEGADTFERRDQVGPADSQMTDVVMRQMSEAQADEHAAEREPQDAKMVHVSEAANGESV